MSTAERPKWIRPLVLAAGVLAAVNLFHLFFPVVFNTWNERLNDRLLTLKTSLPGFKPEYDGAIVHVDLNNTSLRALKDYHPSRAHYARVIHNLGLMKVGVQMCDIIFAGETRSEHDQLLMDATRQASGVVFGMALRLAPSPAPGGEAEDPEARAYLRRTLWRIPASSAAEGFLHGIEPLLTLGRLAELSRGTGYLTLSPDPDGVIRRLPLLVRFEDGFYPSFALKSVCEYLKVPPEGVEIGPGAIILRDAVRPGESLRSRLLIPIDSQGSMRITFAGPWGRMKHYNFSDIHSASDDRELLEAFQDELEGRVVLLSDISTGSADMGQVPIDELYPLSGVHANAVNTILTANFIRDLPGTAAAAIEIGLVLGVMILSFHRSALVSAGGTVGIGALYAAAVGLAFLQWNLLAPLARPLIAMVLAWAGLSTWHGLENARARAELERARQLTERELEIGRTIQTGFLPPSLPAPAGWEIAAYFQPARQVSGDFYDVFELSGSGFFGIVIADICDHGVGSALYMALTRTLIRAFALQNSEKTAARSADPAFWPQAVALKTVEQANAYVANHHGDTGMFATLFFGILNPATGEMTCVNCGHEPPALIRRGQVVKTIRAKGLAIGVLPDAPFAAETLSFEAGDLLLLYTDGLTDAEPAAGGRFTKERLLAIASGMGTGARALVAGTVAELNRHLNDLPPADDVTLLAVGRSGPESRPGVDPADNLGHNQPN